MELAPVLNTASLDLTDEMFQFFNELDFMVDLNGNQVSNVNHDDQYQCSDEGCHHSVGENNSVSCSFEIERPLQTSTLFCIGLSHAFNAGDTEKIIDLTSNFTHERVHLRIKNSVKEYTAVGSNMLAGHLISMMDQFPDGVLFVKSVIPGKVFGHRVLRMKYYFTGTKLVNNKKNNDVIGNSKTSSLVKVVAKGLSVCYLDQNNRIVIIDDTARPVVNDRILVRSNRNRDKKYQPLD